MGNRPDLVTFLSSSVARCLVCIERDTSNPVPVWHSVVRVADSVDGDGKIVEIGKIVFNCEAYNVCAGASELLCSRIQSVSQRFWQSYGLVAT